MLYKYPRTPHLSCSKGISDDDEIISDMSVLENARELIWSEKMDGENITIYADGTFHSRSVDAPHKVYHSYLQAAILPTLTLRLRAKNRPYRLCCEYMFARHAIPYDNLDAFLLVHSIWIDDQCLDWFTTKLLCRELGLATVPVLVIGPYCATTLNDLIKNTERGTREGFVVRNSGEFSLADFPKNVAKYVRANRPLTPQSWSWNNQNHLHKI